MIRTRIARTLLAFASTVAIGFAGELAAQQQPVASPRDTARMEAAGATVLVDYGRPYMRGRKIMGGLVPYGKVWRTGANAATTLVTEADLRIGDTEVPKGTYTLYTLPTAEGWHLIVNRQTGQWGTQYDPAQDLARIPMRVTRLRRPVEQFTIALEPGKGGPGEMVLTWENTRASVPLTVKRGDPAHTGHRHR
ncbi:MAG TPA: DUF2911 domain-containing protein [Longimicrobiaceae bacterium]|nr:DUF2911 domain-containing protein [Longimicrobiaceae bacterium]